MTPQELSANEDLNRFYRALIAFQAHALAYVSLGGDIEDRIARAAVVTEVIQGARGQLITPDCSCPPDQVCCNDGSCAQPGFCNVVH